MEILFISADVAKMLNGKTYGENLYFNPVQDEEGRWFISQEEVNGFFAKHPIHEPVEVDEIAVWRVRAALEIRGLTQSVETLLSSIEGEKGIIARAYWSNEKEFNRYHGLIEELGEAMKITHPDFDIDEFFAFAQTIKL